MTISFVRLSVNTGRLLQIAILYGLDRKRLQFSTSMLTYFYVRCMHNSIIARICCNRRPDFRPWHTLVLKLNFKKVRINACVVHLYWEVNKREVQEVWPWYISGNFAASPNSWLQTIPERGVASSREPFKIWGGAPIIHLKWLKLESANLAYRYSRSTVKSPNRSRNRSCPIRVIGP